MLDYQKQFIQFALDCNVLKFAKFKLKSGRISPYFFNTGLFASGIHLKKLGMFYAKALINSKISVDMLYGHAYKGIPLVASVAIAYAKIGQDIVFAFNRKETKDHGEGGVIVGANLQGKVLILDDVITSGASIREAITIIKNEQATPSGVLIALDRQEKNNNNTSTLQELSQLFQIPIISLISLDNIIEFLELQSNATTPLKNIKEYHKKYGI